MSITASHDAVAVFKNRDDRELFPLGGKSLTCYAEVNKYELTEE
jgi:hypothetical protein